jgi:hypothetical protein
MKNTTTTTLLIGIVVLAVPVAAQEKPPATEADQKRAWDIHAQEQALKAQEKAIDKANKAQDKALQEQQKAYRAVLEQDLARAVRATKRGPVATRKETVAFCGIGTSEVPAVLTNQLRLTPGMGLVVDFVDAGSPAETAGVKQYDVLTKFNDQVLVNADQFRVLVQIRQPSDDVKLGLIRQGEPKTVDIELGQKEIDVEVGAAGNEANPFGQQYRVGVTPNGDVRVQRPWVDAPRGGGAAAVAVNGAKRVATWTDDQQTVNLEQDGNRMLLSVTDRAGKDVFRGAVETEEQRKSLPPTVARKLTDLEMKLPMMLPGGRAAAATRVLTSTENDTLMVARFEKGKPAHLLAFSTADGKVVFEGPVATDEQRKALPEKIATQLQTLEQNQADAAEFGVVGRQPLR